MIDKFVNQYLETALWSSTDDNDRPFNENYSIEDIADESYVNAVVECQSFIDQAGDYLHGLDITNVGHDFWLTRNHHGAGFWDGDYTKEVGDFLIKLAHSFGECNLFVGDDGYIYL